MYELALNRHQQVYLCIYGYIHNALFLVHQCILYLILNYGFHLIQKSYLSCYLRIGNQLLS